jgi:hypothetical protein
MDNVLVRIKRMVLAGRYLFSEKASTELEADGLTELDLAEAVLNAVAIHKTLRARSPRRGQRGEKLYVIVGTTLTGLPLYTKGKFLIDQERETYYFLISSKRAEG